MNAIQIAWASPHARTYQVGYWVGQSPLGRAPAGAWNVFPSGAVKNEEGGTVLVKLAPSPIQARYLRVWMTESSNTCDLHGSDDVRNCVGYAIQDINAGSLDASGTFVAVPRHSGDPSDVAFITSSIDPWHSAADVNATGSYQHTGFDLLFTSGLTNGLPAMIPVTMLYGTPEDSAAQIAYIKNRGYPIGWIEMGEEPDGKHMLPEDYGALYLQWATAIHNVDPTLKLGGPVFEGINEDINVWPNAQGQSSWTGRFVEYLRAHGRVSDLAFWSLEHYPFSGCTITRKDLYREPQMMRHILEAFRENGLPRDIPIMVTESHLAARLTGPMSTIFAALWLADNVGSFFEAGGAAFYHSPIQPQPVNSTCLGWATWSNFVADREYTISGYTSPYFAARLINLEWVQHRSGVHHMYPSSSNVNDNEGHALVTTYAVHRPDDNWSLMLVNRDESSPHTVRVVLEDSQRARTGFFSGPVTLVTFGSTQYVWRDEGANSHADPDGPPVSTILAGGKDAAFTLPQASVTVLRGKVQGLAR